MLFFITIIQWWIQGELLRFIEVSIFLVYPLYYRLAIISIFIIYVYHIIII